jgi:hypothetical protein
MNIVPCDVPISWGADTSWKLSPDQAERLARSPLPNGQAIRFLWRYVGLGPNGRGDIDRPELEGILAARLILLLVQHCRAGSWLASGSQGATDGEWAARNAGAVGYPKTGCLALDLESVANPGAAVQAHALQWCAQVAAAGFEPVIYVGFDCGLSAEDLYNLPNVRRYWSDAGPRQVTKRGFCCHQFPETTVAGMRVDPDHAFPDLLGGTLVGAAEEQEVTKPELPPVA